MDTSTTNLRDIKKMRLERHWSQDQLAEMSGLSKREEIEQIRKEEEYVQNIKGFYGIIALAVLSLGTFFIIAIFDSEGWNLFFYMLIFYVLFLGIYSLNIFDFFGDDWKRKIINKKFKKKY